MLLIVNRNSADSLAIGNYYRIRRGVPEANVLLVDWPVGKLVCTFAEYDAGVRRPALKHLADAGIAEQVAVWVTTPDLPQKVGGNSVSSVVLFGRELDAVDERKSRFAETNPYFNRWQPFATYRRRAGAEDSFLHMLLDAGDVPATLAMIERAAAVDGTHPAGTVHLLDGAGVRASRKVSIPQAERFLQALGAPVEHHVGGARLTGETDILGLYTGVTRFPVDRNAFAPGALADHLTSLGGVLHKQHDQMRSTAFLAAGCSASYGAVTEPYNYPAKFPTAMLHAYYRAGYSAVESYAMSVQWPQHGLFLGDPLTAPFATPPTVSLAGVPAGARVTGNVTVQASARAHPESVGAVLGGDLLMDGRRFAGLLAKGDQPGRWTVRVGDRTVSVPVEGLRGIGPAIRSLRETLLAEAGIASEQHGTLLFLLDPRGAAATLSAGSDCPTAPIAAAGPTVAASEPQPSLGRWTLTPAGGDATVTVAVATADGTRELLSCRVTDDDAGLARLERHAAAVGDGFRMQVRRDGDGDGDAFRLAVLAAADRTRDLPRVTVAAGAWQVSPAGATLLADPSLKSYALGVLRCAGGKPSLNAAVPLDTTKLSDGRHTLALVAVDGGPANSAGAASVSFVVDNRPENLVLTLRTALIAADATAAPVATAAAGAAGPVRWFVDGRGAGAGAELSLDAADWGPGWHQVRAEAGVGDTLLRSDNELAFEIKRR